MAKITAIEFKRTVSKAYQSRTVGVTIEVGPDDNPAEVQAAAEMYVATQLGEVADPQAMAKLREQVKAYEDGQKMMHKITGIEL